MQYCAPGKGSDGSCFSLEALRRIAEAYNQSHPAHPIERILRKTKAVLVKEITERLSGVCPNQWCWLDLDFVKDLQNPEIDYLTFRPERPEGQYQWLSTDNIFKVMRQYQETYSDFRFFGPVPIDFAQTHQELAQIKLDQLYRQGVRKIGVVYNLDPHDKPGSHWVALFVDLNKKTISFFDSYGTKPAPPIRKFMNHVASFYSKIGLPKKKFTINLNTHRHQYANSECGVYSMYFLVQSLKGRGFNRIVSDIVGDEEMNSCRLSYFRPNNHDQQLGRGSSRCT